MRLRHLLAAGAIGAGLLAYPVTPEDASHGVRACASEESPGPCVWDAHTRGNDRGRSFIRDASGRIHYVDSVTP